MILLTKPRELSNMFLHMFIIYCMDREEYFCRLFEASSGEWELNNGTRGMALWSNNNKVALL